MNPCSNVPRLTISSTETNLALMRVRQEKNLGLCSRCRKPNDRKPQRYCRSCHAEYMRKTRCKHSDLPEEQRLKANCRAYANVYQRRGKLIPQPCESCGSENAEKHHPDYTQPLNVIWLCRPCHLFAHAEQEQP